MSAQRQFLSGDRWHFQHGPIDIVIGATGDAQAVRAAHEAAWHRFTTVLQELVAELPQLRAVVQAACPVHGAIARRMWQACEPFRAGFITPMAAVAGSVAQELIACYDRPGVDKAWVNNGGDVALHLAPGESLRVGLFADLGRLRQADAGPLRLDGDFRIDAATSIRGVATSGWRGRSFSLGIADSVTVLARTAAQADAAATVIANAVDADDARIRRRPACDLKDDTDLGHLPVTVDVPPLDDAVLQRALRLGTARARALRQAGLIESAVLVCQGWFATQDTQPARLAATATAGPELLPA
jgi:ApbE superfamily uncharacterized protein (UPF0280 family)